MLRRFLVTLVQRSFLVLLLICLGCAAQSAPSADTSKAIERQVRAYYKLPPDVTVSIGPVHPSDFNNYDAVKLTFNRGTRKDEYDFLLSKDGKTLIKLTKLDLTKDPNAEVMKKMDVKGRPTRGNKDAKVVVVNYDDFECPFCTRPCFRKSLRNTAIAFCSSTRITRWRKFIPGPLTLRSMLTAWLRRTTMLTGTSPTIFTGTRTWSMEPRATMHNLR